MKRIWLVLVCVTAVSLGAGCPQSSTPPNPPPDTTFTLIYAVDNGSIQGVSTQKVSKGSNGTEVIAVGKDKAYCFLGWSDGISTVSRTDTNVQADISVTAKFCVNTFTLTYTAGDNGSITGAASQTVDQGKDGTEVTAVANEGYHFAGWSDGVATASRTDTNVQGNVNVTASFKADWITIDFPGADETLPNGISGNSVVGYYSQGKTYHGFLYNLDGETWTTIEVPGAYATWAFGTDGNNIVGEYRYKDADSLHGFIYDMTTWTTLDVPEATSTQAYGIDDGNIIGCYTAAGDENMYHGFLYNLDGKKWTTIDLPGASKTMPSGISTSSVIGEYINAGQEAVFHGFRYDLDGKTWTAVDLPDASSTYLRGISGKNIVGYYLQNCVYHSFIYDEATLTVIDYPGAPCTFPCSISGSNVTGYYSDASGNQHGFLYAILEL